MLNREETMLPAVQELLEIYDGRVAAVTVVNEIEGDRKRVETRIEFYPGAFAIPQE